MPSAEPRASSLANRDPGTHFRATRIAAHLLVAVVVARLTRRQRGAADVGRSDEAHGRVPGLDSPGHD